MKNRTLFDDTSLMEDMVGLKGRAGELATDLLVVNQAITYIGNVESGSQSKRIAGMGDSRRRVHAQRDHLG